ncbi:hypothetical protein KR018_007172, partial [Drosophila ironensis]
PQSNFGAFISLLKCVVGTGILALPLAFYYAGIIFGFILLVLTTFLLIHSMQMLIISMVECARRTQQGYCTYPDAMKYSFAQGPPCFKSIAAAGGIIVNVVLCCSHYGTCVVYLVFVAESLKQLVDFHITEIDVRICVVIVGICSIPVFMIRSLKWLVPFNLTASVLIYIGFLCILYYLFTDLPPLSERAIVFGKVELLPLFFGIALFAVTSVGVMLAIEAKMEHPEQYVGWFGVLDIAIFVVIISYSIFGVFGYWRFGDDIEGSVSLNLPTKETVAQISKAFILCAIFFTYPLSGYVVIDIIMNQYWNKSGELEKAKIKETIIRLIFILLTTINAIAFPNLGPLLSFFGAFTISLLNLVFPALIEICLYYPPEFNYGPFRWKLVKDIFIAILGTIILIQGSAYSIIEMIKEYGGKETTKPPDTTA